MRRCPVWMQFPVSVLLVVHFLATFFVVTGVSQEPFSGPPICQKGNQFFRPYLATLVLTCPYRFYVPDPGIAPTLWVRVHFESGQTVCLEFPDFRKSVGDSRFFRQASIASSPEVEFPKNSQHEIQLTPKSGLLLSSYTIHLANVVIPEIVPSIDSPIAMIDFYQICRVQLPPAKVPQGWSLNSVWLNGGFVLGRYKPDGNRISGAETPAIDILQLVSAIVQEDIQPYLNSELLPSSDLDRYSRRWPVGVDSLLQTFPELKELKGHAWQLRFQELATPTESS